MEVHKLDQTEHIAERLRNIRAKRNLSQQQLAAIGNVSKSSQSQYEQGTRVPDAHYLIALDEHGIDIYQLLTGKGNLADNIGPDDIELITTTVFSWLEKTSRSISAIQAGRLCKKCTELCLKFKRLDEESILQALDILDYDKD